MWAQYVFDSLSPDDEDKSGDVSMQEIVTLMTASKDKAGAGIQHVTDVLTKLSDANGGSISLEQFEVRHRQLSCEYCSCCVADL